MYGDLAVNDIEVAIWRQVQHSKSAELSAEMGDEQALLVPLVLSLARLAAQRDAKARLIFGQIDAV